MMAGVAVLAAALAVGACGGTGKTSDSSGSGSGEPISAQTMLPQGSEPVDLNPADFSIVIDNPYWPMSPGSTWVYSESDTKGGKQRGGHRSHQ